MPHTIYIFTNLGHTHSNVTQISFSYLPNSAASKIFDIFCYVIIHYIGIFE